MPNDSSGKTRVNDGWNGAIAQKGGNLEEGWQPATEKHGYQPAASNQPPSPPQGGSAMRSQSSGSQGSGSSDEKR